MNAVIVSAVATKNRNEKHSVRLLVDVEHPQQGFKPTRGIVYLSLEGGALAITQRTLDELKLSEAHYDGRPLAIPAEVKPSLDAAKVPQTSTSGLPVYEISNRRSSNKESLDLLFGRARAPTTPAGAPEAT